MRMHRISTQTRSSDRLHGFRSAAGTVSNFGSIGENHSAGDGRQQVPEPVVESDCLDNHVEWPADTGEEVADFVLGFGGNFEFDDSLARGVDADDGNLVLMQVDAEEDFGLETQWQLKLDRDIHRTGFLGCIRQLPDSVNNVLLSHFRISDKKCKKHYHPLAAKHHTRIIHGFTLIELLVVIAIISLLVSIMLPSLNKAKELAKGVKCASNLKSQAIAFIMYAGDNNGVLPPFYTAPAKKENYTNYLVYGGYTPAVIWQNEPWGMVSQEQDSIWLCPSAESFTSWGAGYGAAYWHVFPYTNVGWGRTTSLSLDEVRRSSEIVMVGDVQYSHDDESVGTNALYCSVCWDWNVIFSAVGSTRHNDGGNYSFIDGHVSWVSYDNAEANESNMFAHKTGSTSSY